MKNIIFILIAALGATAHAEVRVSKCNYDYVVGGGYANAKPTPLPDIVYDTYKGTSSSVAIRSFGKLKADFQVFSEKNGASAGSITLSGDRSLRIVGQSKDFSKSGVQLFYQYEDDSDAYMIQISCVSSPR